MIYYESGIMAREQKLEKLKEIDEKLTLLEINKKKQLDYEEYKNKLKQKANEIGEELIGCGERYATEAYWDKTEKVFVKCEINNLCPTCQEAKEILARINNA